MLRKLHFIFLFNLLSLTILGQTNQWIRINQLGYLPNYPKVAVWVSKDIQVPSSFELIDVKTQKVAYQSKTVVSTGAYGPFQSTARLDFSGFKKTGSYYLKTPSAQSPVFRIDAEVFRGSADFILKYMRQQRSGYNPFLKDSCHREDGFIVYHPDPKKDSTHLDVSGGWHDASDYLQYVTTSANATFQMLFAYQQNPKVYQDHYDAWGNAGKNGIPDILDEAKWGLDWLVKMNPAPHEYYNQLADDRDHRGLRLPNLDKVQYATNQGLARPVYFITGKIQGYKHKNRTTGVASSVGKFASTFALGSEILAKYYPQFAESLKARALDAYTFGKEKPGVSQTAPGGAPYFYEEDNWVDDMELAATQLAKITQKSEIWQEASNFGHQEPTTPWMGADTARHYQWYPFVNLGHYFMAKDAKDKAFASYIELGLEKVFQRGKNTPFLNGVPFVWCSNNYVAGILTQAILFRQLTGSTKYQAMEMALCDWLMGCNPWGTSMICGFPTSKLSPTDPHSAFTHLYNYKIDGGLVDGPVYGSIWSKLIGITLYHPDEYADFQSKLAVYHDDFGDYSTDEPTMDGTASLSFLLSFYEKEGQKLQPQNNLQALGGIVRMDTTQKEIYLCFTAHEFNEGASIILNVLQKKGIKANFFLTGDYLRNPSFQTTVKRMIQQKHYVGPHSDRHLLYAPWEKRDSLLVDKTTFMNDLQNNLNELKKFGLSSAQINYFMPAYEWYNQSISDWTAEMGLKLVNNTGGTSSQADYTTPDAKNYLSSEEIYRRIFNFEEKTSTGLNGALLLTHLGVGEKRTDKFYDKLEKLISELQKRGYKFEKLK